MKLLLFVVCLAKDTSSCTLDRKFNFHENLEPAKFSVQHERESRRLIPPTIAPAKIYQPPKVWYDVPSMNSHFSNLGARRSFRPEYLKPIDMSTYNTCPNCNNYLDRTNFSFESPIDQYLHEITPQQGYEE